ncbi:hypothetical protein M4951_06880 [Blastopirellula sp. J2-11]|uniref:hypothetical protein n=1 Tax=Blastopirellula sp. J2-11 TaxID=2943192 RepID=UPI0021C8BAD1|nr:hypothetical protein [Blastopirellula sp. J2-11]UUO08035.1 hypothetical protein M4951_06880 [Blastopirellula sp. J2-11]
MMLTRENFALTLAFLLGLLIAFEVRAQQPNYVQENGVTYREVVDTVQRPVVETTMQQHTEQVYVERYTTDVHESQRTYHVPVTEYRWEAYTPISLNIFAPPRIAYRWAPQTRWEPRVETVRTPVTRRDLVPETRTVSRPVTTTRMVDEKRISRVAVSNSPASSRGASNIANAPLESQRVGGLGMQADPPRVGTRLDPQQAPSRFR